MTLNDKPSRGQPHKDDQVGEIEPPGVRGRDRQFFQCTVEVAQGLVEPARGQRPTKG